ncbi:PREDICTED: geranylgeranyl pyrophosphate synthase-like [Vollenhovia emeryi]|uniref:geranylgeranyl pyrophosphate synthase-like n=1 Tax=Vollenhovia emeryi TaxID=411798 RepID=UPI0005F502EC|nr:PREDICTED: geranylgeranyl pyrophosphate synthase-like [Vollenhovia emeryi]
MFILQHAILQRLSNASTFCIVRNIHSHLVLRKGYTTNQNDVKNTIDNNPYYYSTSCDRKENEKLLAPIRYLAQTPGTLTTTTFIKAINYWLKTPDDKLLPIKDIVNMLLLAATIVDDIQDNSIMRRDVPVAHAIYGIPHTLNAVNYVYFIGLERALSLQHPEAVKVYMEQALDFHRGQGIELHWTTNCICPTEADYKTMIKNKTAVFYFAQRVMQLFSTFTEDLSLITDTFRLLFFIGDDYCDIWLDEDVNSKGYCDDLAEGKVSLPIIHALTNNLDNKELISILKQRTKDNEVRRYCVHLLEKNGSFEYVKNVLEELDSIGRAEVERLGGNPLFVRLLDQLKTWNRKHASKSTLDRLWH